MFFYFYGLVVLVPGEDTGELDPEWIFLTRLLPSLLGKQVSMYLFLSISLCELLFLWVSVGLCVTPFLWVYATVCTYLLTCLFPTLLLCEPWALTDLATPGTSKHPPSLWSGHPWQGTVSPLSSFSKMELMERYGLQGDHG